MITVFCSNFLDLCMYSVLHSLHKSNRMWAFLFLPLFYGLFVWWFCSLTEMMQGNFVTRVSHKFIQLYQCAEKIKHPLTLWRRYDTGTTIQILSHFCESHKISLLPEFSKSTCSRILAYCYTTKYWTSVDIAPVLYRKRRRRKKKQSPKQSEDRTAKRHRPKLWRETTHILTGKYGLAQSSMALLLSKANPCMKYTELWDVYSVKSKTAVTFAGTKMWHDDTLLFY